MKKIEILKRLDIDLLSHHREWENFEENNISVSLNALFVSHNCEEIKLADKSRYKNKRKDHVIFLMINDEAKNCYYFAVNLSELNSLGWLRGKKEAIINNDNSFQNDLNDALNYQTVETNLEKISKLKPCINRYNWEGIKFPAGPKDWKKFEQNNKTTALKIFLYHTIQKQ